MISIDNLTIRAMNQNDFPLMAKWLSHPEVLKFYEESPYNLEQVFLKYGPRVEGKHYVKPCIVEYKLLPIGYIQYYPVQDSELKAYAMRENGVIFGIDQFIGEPEMWGKGIGTSMVSLMLKYLSQVNEEVKVVLDVKKNNIRAIACYKKCGFRIVKVLEDEKWLMEWKKSTVS
ncbi:GNAT family N-acetyltransferase [Bacillus sp. 31A1R]|uniref:GNAT family N-acetyltransferase n=1 Tax=Robertmurraya mangrovi TaxID=3098077 RepID=A0ABU5J113_9BACI|nr:GNAT family N-acetyltransferase [Bacillus sp. 31A1R]MDZ5473057.1 GNAT family N-acetyltransferase [Bacillus sp. 31A1R]